MEVEDGRPVRVTGDRANPAYHGFTCAKGRQLPALHAHPDRLLHSQKRTADGPFEPIASARAIDEVAARIQDLIARYGPRSIALYVGTYSGPHPATIPFAIGWLLAAGSRMVFTAATIDQPGKNIANALHGRWLGGSHVFDESDAWLLVGNNPLISMSGGIPPANPARRLRDAKARGMKLVVIDPRRTETARSADVYLQPRPGEDPALLAALLHVVIREGLFDRDFARDHVSGFAELEAAVAPFTPRFAAERAGVAAEDIERAARAFGGARRGCGVAGTGPNMAPRGNLTEYLLLCLNTVCGRWRRAGERVANPGALLPKAVPVAQAQAPRRALGFGEKLRVRGLANSAAGLPTAALADEILEPGDGRIRALICVGSNPIAAWPDQHKTRRAIDALDLLVTLDMKLSATSRLAHYVIAPKLSLEVPGLSLSMEALEQTYVAMGYSEPYAQYTPAIAQPPPGADVIEVWEFFYGLAQRMGLALSLYPTRAETGVLRERSDAVDVDMAHKPTTDEIFADLVARSRVPLAEVKQHAHGAIFADPPILVAPGDP
ncbi:MAG: molybdopterin dinucleotide-binding protein, partial [Deltaproteobacteria bacterium]